MASLQREWGEDGENVSHKRHVSLEVSRRRWLGLNEKPLMKSNLRLSSPRVIW